MSKLKILLIVFVVTAIPVALSAQTTNATSEGEVLTNYARATYTNSGGANYTNNTSPTNFITNMSIYGLSTTITANETNSTVPGVPITFQGQVINHGNTNQVVNFTNLITNYSAGASGWTVDFLNDALVNATSMTLNEGSSRVFYLQVTPTGGASAGQSLTNQFAAKFPAASTRFGSAISSYTGFSGTNYGGTNQTTGKIAITVVEALQVAIDKYSFVTNSAGYIAIGGGGNEPVPGSMITYAITYTNTGSVSAYNLTLTDPIDIANVEYVPNSMVYRDGAMTDASEASYNAATGPLGDGPADDGVGAFTVEGDDAGGNMTFTFAAPITSGARGTVYYKVYIK